MIVQIFNCSSVTPVTHDHSYSIDDLQEISHNIPYLVFVIFVIIIVFIIIVDFVNVNVLSCLLPGKRVYSSYLESVVSSEPETYRDIRGLMERCQVSKKGFRSF